MVELFRTLIKQKRQLSYRYSPSGSWERDADEITLARLFMMVGPSLIPEYSLEACSRLIALHIRKDESKAVDIAPYNVVKSILTELMALELVAPSARRHSVKDESEYWSLTELGIEFLKWYKLQQINDPEEAMTSEPVADPAVAAAAKKAVPSKTPAKKAVPAKTTTKGVSR